jgi:hypothetical protein
MHARLMGVRLNGLHGHVAQERAVDPSCCAYFSFLNKVCRNESSETFS